MTSTFALRLKNARLRNGFSLQQVADQVGLSKQMISKYEMGLSMPGSETLINLSRLLRVRIDHLFQKSDYVIGEISFRKRSKLRGKRELALKEIIRTKIEQYFLIEDQLGISHEFKNPLVENQISSVEQAQNAAYLLKEKWHIGQDAIFNAVGLLEEKHIKVIEIEDFTGDFDGLATWVDGKYPLIVLSKTAPVERKRFTLFHELGHIVLSMNKETHSNQEKYCHAFASEMLLSRENLVMELGSSNRRRIYIEEIKNLQIKYGMSISAIVYKLGDMEFLSKEQIRNFFIKLRSDQSFKNEVDYPRYQGIEHSNRFENLVLRALSEESISLSKASSLLDLSISDLSSNFLQPV